MASKFAQLRNTLGLLAVAALVMTFAAPATAVTLSLSETEAISGETVEVLLNIDDGREVAGYQATINYDSAQLSNPRVNSSLLNNGQNTFSHVPQDGELRIVSYADTLETFGGDESGGPVASILFDVAPGIPGGSVIPLGLTNVAKSDQQGSGGAATQADSADGQIVIVTSPRWYFGEGDTEDDFQTFLLVVNPNEETAELDLTVLFEDREPEVFQQDVPGNSRFTFPLHALVDPSKFSMQLISTNDVPVFAERAIYWQVEGVFRTGGTDFIGSRELEEEWFLAEGTTTGGRETFILVGNPNTTPSEIDVTYLREGADPVTVPYTVPAQRRLTITTSADVPNTNFSTRVTSTNDVPIVVDRTMRGGADGILPKWGHTAAGVTELSDQWFLAEGAVHTTFETFILIANPNPDPVDIQLRFLRTDESPFVPDVITVAGESRRTINVELTYPGQDEMLDRAGFSTEVTTVGGETIAVERAQFFTTTGFSQRSLAAAVVGIPEPGTNWFLPEGAVFGSSNFETFILVGNPSDDPANVTVTYFRDNGAPIVFDDVVPAGERKTFKANLRPEFPSDQGTQSFATGVESTNGVPIVTERAMFWSTVPGVSRYEGHASKGIAQ